MKQSGDSGKRGLTLILSKNREKRGLSPILHWERLLGQHGYIYCSFSLKVITRDESSLEYILDNKEEYSSLIFC